MEHVERRESSIPKMAGEDATDIEIRRPGSGVYQRQRKQSHATTDNMESGNFKSPTNLGKPSDGRGPEAPAVSKPGRMANFSQQKLRAWQPVLTPRWIVSVFLAFGALFIVLGILLLLASSGVVECVYEYQDPDDVSTGSSLTVTIDASDCVGPFHGSIASPIFLYYELSNYYQNHRRYVKSRNDEQLRGVVYTDSSSLSSCDPLITDNEGKIFSPCGLVARSVFNDTFRLLKDGVPIEIKDAASVIAWSSDIEYKFKNPTGADPAVVNEWLDETIFPGKVENGHFIVWMRSAALPTFRKLYARIDNNIELPIQVQIENRYPVASFRGKKRVVLSTTSWLGGRNSFLGVAYLFIGTWCFIFGIFFIVKNYKTPRLLGDVRYLKTIGNRGTR